MLYHEGNLIAMPSQHDSLRVGRLLVGAANGNHVNVSIGANIVGILLGPYSNDILHWPFVTGWTRRGQEILEKLIRFRLHGLFKTSFLVPGVRQNLCGVRSAPCRQRRG